MNHNFFIHSLLDEHLTCFQFWNIKNKVALVSAYKSLFSDINFSLFFLGNWLGMRLLCHMAKYMFLGTATLFPKVVALFYIPINNV